VFKARSENPVQAYAPLFESVSHARPDVVVLSESALAEFGDSVDSGSARRFAAYAMEKTGARAVLAGGSRRDGGKMYNSAALFVKGDGGDAAISGVYDKVHLVPFGEYIPFDKTFEFLQELSPVGSCHEGTPRLLDFEGAALAVAICYEDTDSSLVRSFAKMGADILVFITNDSWFSESNEAMAHFWHATARAIETGLPVVRVGNSGVTAAISPDGRPQILSDGSGVPLVDACGVFSATVPVPAARLTVYSKTGDVPLAAAFLVALAAIVAALRCECRKMIPVAA
jgi:apolipoprotein N-acyltransferase